MHPLLDVRRLAGVSLLLLLSACSGGGGDTAEPQRTSVSTDSIAFDAEGPDAETPAAQTFTATFGSDIANLSLVHSGRAVLRVTSKVSGNTAQITVEPAQPDVLGPGVFTGTIAVTGYFCADTACSALRAGNTQNVNVRYQISPLVRYVAPYVATSGTKGRVILRGYGFGGFPIEGVRFGSVNATEMLVVSDSEIRVEHPALEAGTYDVSLDIPTHEGDVPSSATLVVLDPQSYGADTLTYPTENLRARSIFYDAERSALFVVTTRDGGTLLRYPFEDGAWGEPLSVEIEGLRDAALSTNGTHVFALTTTSISTLDAIDLTEDETVEAEDLPEDGFLKNIAITNENRAIITTGINESAVSPLFQWVPGQEELFELRQSNGNLVLGNNATPGVSRNGLAVVFAQGYSSTTTAPAIFAYSSSTRDTSLTTRDVVQNAVRPVADRNATRFAVNGRLVFNGAFEVLGTLPTTTAAVAFNTSGSRAYTFDSTSREIRTFDSSKDKDGLALPEVGDGVALATDPGESVKMTISDDGETLFLAGSDAIVIQPTP